MSLLLRYHYGEKPIVAPTVEPVAAPVDETAQYAAGSDEPAPESTEDPQKKRKVKNKE